MHTKKDELSICIIIQNKDELIKNYGKIFHADYNAAISKAPTKYLFVNY